MDGHGAAMKTGTNQKAMPQKNVNNIPQDRAFEEETIHAFTNALKYRKDGEQKEISQSSEPSGEVNMEAAISPDDVVRAGGFGARDGLGSALPIAIDSTDLESSFLDMCDYEEPQGERHRPGLGWSKDKESE